MRHLWLFIIMIITCQGLARAEADGVALQRALKAGLPVVVIETVDGVMPTCDYATAPEGCMGETVINATKVAGRLQLMMPDGGVVYDSGEYVDGESGVVIKRNGNTSATYNEQNFPMKLKLEKKADLLLRDDAQYADREWRLVCGDHVLKYMLGWHVSKRVGMAWTPEMMVCSAVMNGEFRGVYLLIENVKRSNSRVKVKKDEGYIIENDPYWWKEERWFATPHLEQNKSYRWTYKYPSDSDVTDEQEQYIKNYICEAEDALYNGTADASLWLDYNSMARWILVHDIIGTTDGGGSNMYFAKEDNTGETLLTMPLVWDLDCTFTDGYTGYCNMHNSPYRYFQQLFSQSDGHFVYEYKKAWDEVKDVIAQELIAMAQEYLGSELEESLKKAYDLSDEYLHSSYAEYYDANQEAKNIIAWITQHDAFLKENIAAMTTNWTPEHSSVVNVSKTPMVRYYDPVGRRVINPTRQGIYKKVTSK